MFKKGDKVIFKSHRKSSNKVKPTKDFIGEMLHDFNSDGKYPVAIKIVQGFGKIGYIWASYERATTNIVRDGERFNMRKSHEATFKVGETIILYADSINVLQSVAQSATNNTTSVVKTTFNGEGDLTKNINKATLVCLMG